MLIVQKFGGTSVGSLERIEAVCDRVIECSKDNQIIVVVSAMSGETNKLTEYAHHFSSEPSARDFDMILSSGEVVTSGLLSIAFNAKGRKAIALNGAQAKIVTSHKHTQARIQSIDTTYMKQLLDDGYIVVVTGFQGVSEDTQETTTLGRGGSDLSAVAIAGAMNADLCEIYTDVDGIYTTDPRIEPKAKKIERIFYDSMLELASAGAKVLHSRSVELAKKLNINLVTRNSFNENEGTLITSEDNIVEKPIVTGIALDKNQARVSIMNVDDVPGIAAKVFFVLSENGINVDMIVQNVAHDNKTNIDFTIPKSDLQKTKDSLLSLDFALDNVEFDENICKVSLVGVGMKSHSGVASKAFNVFHDENINIMMISTSEIKISVVVQDKYGELAVRSLHAAYELDK